jgi:hypothetical protein
MQLVVLMNSYSTIKMPANAKQMIQTFDGIMKLDALNTRKLA